MKKPIALIIMDGIGLAKASGKNAVSLSNTPTLNKLIEIYPKIQMRADGTYVGLPKGQMGNSEVGHLNIGAGRVVYQSLTKIDQAIEDNEFASRPALKKAIDYSKKNNSAIHIMGLISDGGVHSHINHIIELYKIAKSKTDKVFVHGFLDGRDVAQQSAKQFISQLEENGITLASISGRFYAMDRDTRWERIQLAYDSLTKSDGPSYEDVNEYIDSNYAQNIYDEFIVPAYNKKINTFVKDGDLIIFANFRPDRARQMSHMFLKDSKLFDYKPSYQPKDILLVTMMAFTGIEVDTIFDPEDLSNLLGETISKAGRSQIRGAETEKYPHVTFFLDGGNEIDLPNSKKILVPSPSVETYDLKPEMSAVELCDEILKVIEEYDAAIINFANGDMVGHTGSIAATIKAVETVDQQIKRLYDKIVTELNGILIIVADHGNADEMVDEDGNPMTKHSLNPVPVIITSSTVEFKEEFRTGEQIAKLGDLAPTMLKLLKIEKPNEMTGKCLIK